MMKVPYHIVVEEQEYDDYVAVIDKNKILVLDKQYQRDYDTFDDLGDTKSKGPGAARNFVWDHAISNGYSWHWVMDDNITTFFRLNRNKYYVLTDGTGFRCMEDFCLRYEYVGMAGPNYKSFIPRKQKMPPFILNTRIYSCNLIRNDVPFRWRGRYNEDTDLSLRLLKRGWRTIQFYAFFQDKLQTQTIKGGNTKDFYVKEGTQPKSEMQVKMHPDVSKLVWRFGRIHHHVDYSGFRKMRLIKKADVTVPEGVDEYGLVVRKRAKKVKHGK